MKLPSGSMVVQVVVHLKVSSKKLADSCGSLEPMLLYRILSQWLEISFVDAS